MPSGRAARRATGRAPARVLRALRRASRVRCRSDRNRKGLRGATHSCPARWHESSSSHAGQGRPRRRRGHGQASHGRPHPCGGPCGAAERARRPALGCEQSGSGGSGGSGGWRASAAGPPGGLRCRASPGGRHKGAKGSLQPGTGISRGRHGRPWIGHFLHRPFWNVTFDDSNERSIFLVMQDVPAIFLYLLV